MKKLNTTDIENDQELFQFMSDFAMAVKKGLSRSSDIASACRKRIKRYEDTREQEPDFDWMAEVERGR